MDNENNITNNITFNDFFKKSTILTFWFNLVTNFINQYTNQSEFLSNIDNKRKIILGTSIFLFLLTINLLWNYIFYILYLYVSSKVVLFLFEHYEPNLDKELISTNGQYVSENNSMDIIEYMVVLIFLNVMNILLYIPFISVFIYPIIMLTGIMLIINKKYRQSLCLLLKSVFAYNNNTETELHKLLQIFVATIESLNYNLFNITYNTKNLYNNIMSIENLLEGLIIISGSNNNNNNNNNNK